MLIILITIDYINVLYYLVLLMFIFVIKPI